MSHAMISLDIVIVINGITFAPYLIPVGLQYPDDAVNYYVIDACG